VPAGWTPDQIRQFQDYWDTEFAGDLAKRRRAKFVPGESAVRVHQTKEPEHKQDFDEWLARIICYAFSVPPQWAVKLMNRATADNQSAQAEDEGLEPTKEWVKDLVDEVIAEEFASPDLELMWLDEDSGATEIEAQFEARVKIGAATLNELRDALGLDPFANPAADRPMVLTATGYVPIEAGGGGNPSQGGGGQTSNGQAASAVQKYNSDQPRVPAGQSAGGQWTKDGEGGPGDLDVGPDNGGAGSDNRPSYAVPVSDSHVISDTTPDNTWKPGAQYAGGPEENENRGRGPLVGGTPAQEARLEIAEREWEDVRNRMRTIDPYWRPTPGAYETIEGAIADLEAKTREAEAHISAQAKRGIGPGPFACESIPAPTSGQLSTAERAENNENGDEYGCHTCGTAAPGTPRGNWVGDHQPPNGLNIYGSAQRIYPQCLGCSQRQGGVVRGILDGLR
jgi:hypothetical protein